MTVKDAINHEYFHCFRKDDKKLPKCEKVFDWSWEETLNQSKPSDYVKIIRRMIYEESLTYHPEQEENPEVEESPI